MHSTMVKISIISQIKFTFKNVVDIVFTDVIPGKGLRCCILTDEWLQSKCDFTINNHKFQKVFRLCMYVLTIYV